MIAPQNTAQEKPTILIIDDNPANLAVLAEYLLKQAFDVLVAQDGETGIERAKLFAPDLILLDILLPGMDGFEICRHLKADPVVQDIPVIFITAYVDDIVRKVAGFEAGAVDYITKPFNEIEVAARVAAHVRMRKLTQRLQEQATQLQKEVAVRTAAEAELLQHRERLEALVQVRTHELEQLNKELEQRVIERTTDLNQAITAIQQTNTRLDSALADIKRANIRLEGLLRFARFLVYEVRSYAAGLEGVAPLLREGFARYPEAAHYQGHLDGVEETVAQMNDLTQRMLILIHEDTLPPSQQQPIDLPDLLAYVRQNTVAFAQLCDFPLQIRLLKVPEVVIYGDPLYLGMACNTGLRNAVEILIEHEQDDDAQVEISVMAQDGYISVRLSDNGPGFPPALLEASALARQNKGGFVIGWSNKHGKSGLGLALMERVAQLHGGTLEIGNHTNQQGAWVEFMLPWRQ